MSCKKKYFLELSSNVRKYNTWRKMNSHVQSHKTDIYKEGVINMGTKLYNKKVDVVTNRQLKNCGSNCGRGHAFFPLSKRPVLCRGVKRPLLEIVQPPLAPVKNTWSQPPVPYILNREALSQAWVNLPSFTSVTQPLNSLHPRNQYL